MPVLAGRFNVDINSRLAAAPEGNLRAKIFEIAEKTRMHKAYAEFCAAYYDPRDKKAVIANLGKSQAYVVMCNHEGKKILYPLNRPNDAIFGDVDETNKRADFNIYDLDNINEYFPDSCKELLKDFTPSQIIIAPSKEVFKRQFSDSSIIGLLNDDGTTYSYGYGNDAVKSDNSNIYLTDLSDNPQDLTFISLGAELHQPQCTFITSSDSDILRHSIESDFLLLNNNESPNYWSDAAEEIYHILRQDNLHTRYNYVIPLKNTAGEVIGYHINFTGHGWYGVCYDPAAQRYGFTYTTDPARPSFISNEEQLGVAKDYLSRMVKGLYAEQNNPRAREMSGMLVDGHKFAEQKIDRELDRYSEIRESGLARRRLAEEERARRDADLPGRTRPAGGDADLPLLRLGGARPVVDRREARVLPAAIPRNPDYIPHNDLRRTAPGLKVLETLRNNREIKVAQEAVLAKAGYNSAEVKSHLDKGWVSNAELKRLIEQRRDHVARVLPPVSVSDDGRPRFEGADRSLAGTGAGAAGERERPSSSMSNRQMNSDGVAYKLKFMIPKTKLVFVDPDKEYNPKTYEGRTVNFPEVAINTPNFYLINSDKERKNKFKYLKDAYKEDVDYQGKDAIEWMKLILCAASLDPATGRMLSQEQVLRAIDYAKRHGGLGSEVQKNHGRAGKNPEEGESFRLFSSRFQKLCANCGIYSGREGSFDGLRLVHIPQAVMISLYDTQPNASKYQNRAEVESILRRCVEKSSEVSKILASIPEVVHQDSRGLG